MQLREIEVFSFRNLEDARIPLAPGTTLLVGDNGQGKTAALEAVGVLATTRSFRHARAEEMARHGTDGFRLAGQVGAPTGVAEELRLEVVKGERRQWRRGVEMELAEYVEALTVVPVTHAQSGIVRGAPQHRRDFLDRGILGIVPGFLRTLASYRRALRQKNALLRRTTVAPEELDAWDARLAAEGAEITARRRDYLALIRRALLDVEPLVVPRDERLTLVLEDIGSRDASVVEGSGADKGALKRALETRLKAARAKEAAAKQALVGPHRDDIVLSHGGVSEAAADGRDIRRFASSGQQRNALLALTLAQVEVFREARGESPVLLVDDVDTEVDPTRLRAFLGHVGRHAQALVSSSKSEVLPELPEGTLRYRVHAGVLRAG